MCSPARPLLVRTPRAHATRSGKPKRAGEARKIGGGIVAGLVALTVCERVDQGAV